MSSLGGFTLEMLHKLHLVTVYQQKWSSAERSFGLESCWLIVRRVVVVLFLRRRGENENKLQQNVSNC